ncbi:MAG: hypothetical protein WCS65_08750 [Verrucomicrobiae bacterium]
MNSSRWVWASLVVLIVSAAAAAEPDFQSAQLVGTVRAGRAGWNPFAASNDMPPAGNGTFAATLRLSASGGRNADGIYAMRFFTNHELRQVYKRGEEPGKLVAGKNSAFADNIIFRVPSDGDYTVRFDPERAAYSISPQVAEITKISSMQINGFVHDSEGAIECFDGRRTRPAEMWDEWKPSHELTRNADGSWKISLQLSAKGGHQKNGVYQCLLSANNNSDWGYSAIMGKPGRLAGGNGYESRVGHIEETAVIFRATRDGTYTLTVWPGEFRFEISPAVEFFQTIEFQVDGDVVPEPWNPAAPSHDMERGADGCWRKTLPLTAKGGTNGIYTMNFSIDGNWALDSIGFGGAWGKTWHSAPQEWNLLFRVPADGNYQVTLDPANGTFAFDPPVKPITEVDSLQISGDFDQFSGDGKGGWNPLDPMHDMATDDGRVFTKSLHLTGGKTYTYKFTANRAGWGWSLVDYPYDGYRRLASHGSPPPLVFECPRDGEYRFTANVVTGDYSAAMIKHR